MINIDKMKREESLKDKCGVFGIYGQHEDVARISYFGLYSLQHRGQEGAGIAVSDGKKIKTIKGLGLVPSVFSESAIASLKGYIAIGHTRYSTTGGNTKNNVQPILLHTNNEDFTLAHNGNIINAGDLRKSLSGIKMKSSTDTEVMGWIINNVKGKTWEEKILRAMPQFEGAYSIVAMSETRLFAFRDPYGFRPLVLGKLNGGFVVSSETCALETTGARYIRDIKPGEVISIDDNGLHEVGRTNGVKKSFCLFEYVYLARPDSVINKELVHKVRQRSGELLAHEAPVGADLVVAIPDSGTSAAIGYSKASGIPFGEILIKNRYIGRTFIQPEQRIRDMGVRMKFNPLREIVKGKRIIIVDDSIVRGTTIKRIIELLRKCGAKKIHIRSCSPPIKYSCYFGVDTPDSTKLIASEMNVEQIKKYINADSLAYLSLRGLVQAARQKRSTFCTACFSGKYPLPINVQFSKTILEKKNQC
jgi:amidophosphoribosyltransferase